MELKHTPGPWLYSISTPKQESEKHGGKNAGANCHIWAKTKERIFGRDPGRTICYPLHWRESSEDAEQIANIKLIAAAPELLEALNTIKSVLTNWNNSGKYSNLIYIAETAINKATE